MIDVSISEGNCGGFFIYFKNSCKTAVHDQLVPTVQWPTDISTENVSCCRPWCALLLSVWSVILGRIGVVCCMQTLKWGLLVPVPLWWLCVGEKILRVIPKKPSRNSGAEQILKSAVCISKSKNKNWNLWNMKKEVYLSSHSTEILTSYYIAINAIHFTVLSNLSMAVRIHFFLKLAFVILAVKLWDSVKKPGCAYMHFAHR